MKTFYEEIISRKYLNMDYLNVDEQDLLSNMDEAEIFNVQNVADYVTSGIKQEWEIPFDFPNLAPPFPFFWMEYIDTRGGDNAKAGFLCSSEKLENNLGWRLALNWISAPEKNLFCPITWIITINENGSIKSLDNGGFDILVAVDKKLRPNEPGFNELNLNDMFIAPLLAISFMHCKNVEMVSQEPKRIMGKRTPRNQSKIKYHVLKIEPMKKILRDEGESETKGIKHALHICRGHFKDFSNGEGLFGKYKGMYWWNSQVRGNRKHGIVQKDYSVMSPENNNVN